MKPIPISTLSPGKKRLLVAFVSAGGLGYAPVASGTFGTLPAIPICWALASLNVWGLGLLGYLGVTAALYFAGEWAASLAEKVYQKKDAGHIVIDEVVGYMVTMLLLPAHSWQWLAAGFFTFRFFDVLKPPPAYRWQSIPAGRGVMIDDVVAGFYGCALLHVVWHGGRAMGWWA